MPDVVGDDGGTKREGMGGDLLIGHAGARAPALQHCAHASVLVSCPLVERLGACDLQKRTHLASGLWPAHDTELMLRSGDGRDVPVGLF